MSSISTSGPWARTARSSRPTQRSKGPVSNARVVAYHHRRASETTHCRRTCDLLVSARRLLKQHDPKQRSKSPGIRGLDTHIYIYIYVYLSLCIYIYIYICLYVMCSYLLCNICITLYIYICVCIYIYIYMYVCVYIYIYIYIYIPSRPWFSGPLGRTAALAFFSHSSRGGSARVSYYIIVYYMYICIIAMIYCITYYYMGGLLTS